MRRPKLDTEAELHALIGAKMTERDGLKFEAPWSLLERPVTSEDGRAFTRTRSIPKVL